MDIVRQVPGESGRREIRSAPNLSKSCTLRVMMYSLGAKRRFPWSDRTPSAASRRSSASTSCGTIDPPNIRANASPTVTSSLALDALNQPLLATHFSALASLCPSIAVGARQTTRPRVVSTTAWYRDTVTLRHRENSENRIGASEGSGRVVGSPRGPESVGARATTVIWSIRLLSGEWRNGRRAGFRCQCPSGRGGSSPPSPTV